MLIRTWRLTGIANSWYGPAREEVLVNVNDVMFGYPAPGKSEEPLLVLQLRSGQQITVAETAESFLAKMSPPEPPRGKCGMRNHHPECECGGVAGDR